MWMSNTACVAMLFPVALAIARTTADSRYATGLMLMLAYAASVGGIATPVGTPPNLIGIALIQQQLGVHLGFLQWMAFGVPLSLTLLVVLYGVLMMLFRPEVRVVPGQLARMQESRRGLGPMSNGERNSLIAFGTAVVLWVMPGLPLTEGVVALVAASVLLLLPADWAKREMTLRWDQAVRIDWGTVLLFGGGIALGRMMFETGLAEAIGRGVLGAFGLQSAAALTGASAAVAAILSEASSNTASANMVIPVMLAVAKDAGTAALSVGIAATLGASMGFMLPISTPPNAIVYGSGAVRLLDMVRAGVLLDLLGFFIFWAACVWLVPLVLG